LSKGFRMPHDCKCRNGDCAKKPPQHQTEPGRIRKIAKPFLSEAEEKGRGGDAQWQWPFASDDRFDARGHSLSDPLSSRSWCHTCCNSSHASVQAITRSGTAGLC